MEKKEKISKYKKDICVIDLTTEGDKYVQASTNSYIPQSKKRTIRKNEASLQRYVEKHKYTTLQDVIKKVKIEKTSKPISENIPNANNTIIIIDSSDDNIDVEDAVPSTSVKENAKKKITSAIPAINLYVENTTILHSKYNTDKKEITPTTPNINVNLEDITVLNSKCNTDKKEITSTIKNSEEKEICSVTQTINLHGEDISILHSKRNTDKKEIALTTSTMNIDLGDIAVLNSKCNKDKKEITPTINNSEEKEISSVTQTIDLDVKDIDVLHSSYETDFGTSFEQITDGIIDYLSEDFSQYFKEVSLFLYCVVYKMMIHKIITIFSRLTYPLKNQVKKLRIDYQILRA